jgi:hypothetical protein
MPSSISKTALLKLRRGQEGGVAAIVGTRPVENDACGATSEDDVGDPEHGPFPI